MPEFNRLSLSPESIEALAAAVAEPVAELLADRLQDSGQTPQGWLAPQAAADYLGVSRQRLADLKYQGKITPDGFDGRTPLYRPETLDRYAERDQ